MAVMRNFALFALCSLSGTPLVFGQTSYPMLMGVSPVAAQIGQSSEHNLSSRYSMFGANQVLVSGNGVTGEVVTPMEPGKDGKEPSLTQIKLKFTVAPDAVPGVRDFRIVGPTGPSTVGQLVIVRDPVIAENPKNDTRETAQDIAIPSTVCGTVEKAEDVDFYKFEVKQPTTLTFHCRGMRLEDKIHDLQTHIDPILSVRNAVTGATIASVDNSFAADPLLTCALEAGSWLLEVRDVRFQGNGNWNYSVEITDRPFVSTVHPLVVTAGQATELNLIGELSGDVGPTLYSLTAALPESVVDRSQSEFVPTVGDVTLNPVPVVVTSSAVMAETEADNNVAETAQPVVFPSIISGRIESEADVDCFSFEAKKNDRISVEVFARRNASGLDSIIRILDDKGKTLVENDDLRLWGKRTLQDSMIENWTVPADGRYTLEIRDVHLRGGAEFVYGLEMTRAEPQFDLLLDSDKTWLTPGTCAAIFVRINRRNGFTGEVQLDVEGLPPGTVAHCGRIPGGTALDGCIVLEAAVDAAPVAANIRVRGTATVEAGEGQEPRTLVAIAQPMQEIYMPGGGRSHWPVEMHTVSVGKPSDILDVKLSTHEVMLKPGESVKVEVELVRSPGFDKNVTLDMLYQHLSSVFANTLPSGVTIDAKNSQTLLTGTTNKGAITLVASKDAAPVDHQQCCIMANVSINFVMKATYSSRPLTITVSPAATAATAAK